MKALIQRVKEASVSVDGKQIAVIGKGLLVLIGIGKNDEAGDIKYIIDKCLGLRIFENENSKFDLSLSDVGGEILLVSQFTLFADCRKGKRPDFTEAAPLPLAEKLYLEVVDGFKKNYPRVQQGEFRAHMYLDLINDGPVTIMLDSKA